MNITHEQLERYLYKIFTGSELVYINNGSDDSDTTKDTRESSSSNSSSVEEIKLTLNTIPFTLSSSRTANDKSKVFEPPIPEGMKGGPLLSEIFKAVPKDIPTALIKIMGNYVYYDDTINEC